MKVWRTLSISSLVLLPLTTRALSGTAEVSRDCRRVWGTELLAVGEDQGREEGEEGEESERE